MSAPPGPPPDDDDDDQDGEQPISDGSEYCETPTAPTSHPSPGEFAAHSASQGLQDASSWASSPDRLLRPERTLGATLISAVGSHGPLAPEETSQ